MSTHFSNHLFESVLENLEDIVLIVDKDRRVLGGNWSDRIMKSGLPDEALPSCSVCWSSGSPRCTTCRIQDVIDTGEPSFETNNGPDFSFSFDVWYKPVMDQDQTVAGAMIILRDMTSIRTAEYKNQTNLIEAEEDNSRLLRAIEHAQSLAIETEASHESMSSFLANMSHDIRTPMTGVLGMTHLLRETKLNSEQAEYVDTAYGSAESLLTIINDILDFSKIEAGKLNLEQIPFDLVSVIEEVADLLALQAHEKGLDFIVKTDPDLPLQLIGDPTRVRQMIINMVGNAIKFTSTGEIELLVEREFGDGSASMIKVSIQDTGIGISPGALATLFEPFTQAENSTSREFGGTGLGLSICMLLAEMMGGEVGVESIVGEGSTFWFTMILDNVSDQEQTPGPTSISDLDECSSIICHPNTTTSGQLEELLSHLGIETFVSGDPGTAYAQISNMEQNPEQKIIALITSEFLAQDPSLWCEIAETDAAVFSLEKMGNRQDWPEDLANSLAGRITLPLKPRHLFREINALITGESPPERTAVKAEPQSVDLKNLSPLRILVAEDNQINQKVVHRFLSKLGIEKIEIVSNGEKALNLLASMDFDIVLMDIQMPVMDGQEAIDHIRQGNFAVRNKDIPIIALTANALAGDREKFIEAGANDYLSKPLDAGFLIEALDRWRPSES